MTAGNKSLRAYYYSYHSRGLIALDNNVKCINLRGNKNLTERICLPPAVILLAFAKAQRPISSHFGFEKTFLAINERIFSTGLHKWIKALISRCINCQASKAQKKTLNTFSWLPFSELTPHFNYRISIDTQGPINPT